MPWKTSSVMEEKLRFVFEYEQGDRSLTELEVQTGSIPDRMDGVDTIHHPGGRS